MKKLILAAAFAVLGVTAVNAQAGFKLGANIGIPVGDISDWYGFTVGADASYLWPVASEFNVGLATGFNSYFLKSDYEGENLNLIPIAASAQYRVSPEFSLGVDLGYGVFTNEGADGGFYYAPKAAYHFGPSEVNLSYRGVSVDGGNVSSINLGYAYSFGK